MNKHLNRMLSVVINLALLLVLGVGNVFTAQAQELPSPPVDLIVIHGKVVNAPSGAHVQAARADGGLAEETSIGPEGQFAFPPLPANAYYLQVVDAQGQLLELTGDSQTEVAPANQSAMHEYILTVALPALEAQPAPEQPPEPKANEEELSGQATTTLDAIPSSENLTAAGTGQISGVVRAADTSNPLAYASVELYDQSGSYIKQTSTAYSSGAYSLTGLATGTYIVYFNPPYGTDYAPKWYDNQYQEANATSVSVTDGMTTPNINASLDVGGKITGTVTAAQGGAPLSGAYVYAYNNQSASTYDYSAYDYTDAAGMYTVTGLPAGTYYLRFEKTDYFTTYYNNKTSLAAADAVGVTLSGTTPGINAALVLGGEITGTVTAAQGGATLSDAGVYVYDSQSASSYQYVAYDYTDAAGVYTVTGLAAGTYYLKFEPPYGSDYMPQYYQNQASLATANPVSVALGSVTNNINAALVLGGKISGKVTAASGGAALQGVYVYLYDSPTASTYGYIDSASTDSAGMYTLTGLTTGAYYLKFAKTDYLTSYYNNKANLAAADAVSVTLGVETPNINAALVLGGRVTGKVTAVSGGAALQGAYVYLYDSKNASSYEYIDSVSTDSSGNYALTGLASGTYYLRFVKTDYLSTYYNNKDSLGTANAVNVTLGAETPNINAALILGGKITGKVTAEDGAAPLQDIAVYAYSSPIASSSIAYDNTDASGMFALTGLPAGTYYVRFRPASDSDYVSQYYNKQSSLWAANPVSVTLGMETPNINAALAVGGRISGQVTAAESHAALPDVLVSVYGYTNVCGMRVLTLFSSATTDDSGNYTVRQLPTGEYLAKFTPDRYGASAAYLEEYYNDKPSADSADPIHVTSPQTTTGIDAALTKGGTITGVVTAEVGGAPLEDVSVDVYTSQGWIEYDYTDATGAYTVTGLKAGSYKVEFTPGYYGSSAAYTLEYYNNKTRYSAADPVNVSMGEVVSGINAALARGGQFTGKVTAEDGGAPLYDVDVSVYDSQGYSMGYGYTDESGNYTTSGLASGSYRLRFQGYGQSQDYIQEYYNNKNTLASADPVPLSAPEVKVINADLRRGGGIGGRVTSSITLNPLRDVRVTIYDGSRNQIMWEYTDDNGQYQARGLATGPYRVNFYLGCPGLHYEIFYNQKPSLASADDVSVTAPAITPNINGQLPVPGAIIIKQCYLPLVVR